MFKVSSYISAVIAVSLFSASSALALPVSGISSTEYNEGTDKAAVFFNPLVVSAVNLTLPQTSVDTLNNDPGTTVYQHASVSITTADGLVTSFSDIGVRIKGQATRVNLSGKAPLKLKFDAFVPGLRFMGLSRMTLNSLVQDPSFVHEDTIYRFFRAMGVIAPRTTYSWVTLNGADFGLYMNVESIDAQMLKRWVTPKHLYSSNCYGADLTWYQSYCYDTNYGDTNRSDLQAAVNVSQFDGLQWWTEVNKVADMTEVINLMATDIYTSNWDGYTDVVQNNYFMVFDTAGKLKIIPWGEDGAFPMDPSAQSFWDGNGPAFRGWGNGQRSVMLRKCVAYEPCKLLLTKAEVAAKLKADQMNLPDFKNKVAAVINTAYISDETRSNPDVGAAFWWQSWLDSFFPARNQSLTSYLQSRSPDAPDLSVTGTPLVGKVLTATGSTYDYTATLTYQWLRDGQPIANATAATYLLMGADDTHLVSCSLSSTKGILPAATTTSTPQLISSSKAPNASIIGNPVVGGILTASPDANDITQVSYKWLRAGKTIAGANGNIYTPVVADLGKAITVTTTVTQLGYPKNITTSNAVVVASGTMTTPTITVFGNPIMNQTLFSNMTTDDGVKATYQWLRDAVAIPGATRYQYALKVDDIGHTIAVRSVFSKTGYTTITKSSAGVLALEATIATSTTPVISGVLKVGKTISATTGAWDSGVRFNYQWFRNGVAVSGATTKTYKTISLDLGKTMTVAIVATKPGYTSINLTSAAVVIN
jgi:hypothetical protein